MEEFILGKRVCIIGAGGCGLTAIKACLEEDLEPECFEKTSRFGGMWKYRESNVDGLSSVNKSTVTKNSKELGAFSDYPPPADFPNFVPHERVYEYFTLYTQKFGLLRHIRFNKNVLQVCKAINHDDTGRWEVQVEDKESNIATVTFDAVLICSGQHAYPKLINICGMDEFKGTILHSHNYKKPNEFENKTIVVVGCGNSGLDIAVELSRVAKKVYLSIRRGRWITYRVDHRGKPWDVLQNTRFKTQYLLPAVGLRVAGKFMATQANWRFDHIRFGLTPSHGFLAQHPTVSDDFANRVLSGTLTVKNDIRYLTERGVCFQQDSDTYDVDAVILATGYNIRFPFLNDDVFPPDGNTLNLYKHVFPSHDGPSTLAFIGMIESSGSVFPLAELQCRWAARVFTGKCLLPPPALMLNDAEKREKTTRSRYIACSHPTIQVDYIDYCDQIAEQIGVRPNLWKMLLRDPVLFHLCIFGPCYPYQYRLNGPHAWAGAADAILKADYRTSKPLKTRQQFLQLEEESALMKLLAPLGAVLVFILVLVLSR